MGVQAPTPNENTKLYYVLSRQTVEREEVWTYTIVF